jgi:hypothetical protein
MATFGRNLSYNRDVQNDEFYDEDFFRTLASSSARALLIGRRALVALGAPVMTTDYDLWLHFDDLEKLNAAFANVDHYPNHEPDTARKRGRYVLENSQHIDVMISRSQGADGSLLAFEDAWQRRRAIRVPGGQVFTPCTRDLIKTKQWAMRPRDLVDIDWLTVLLRTEEGTA